MTFTLYHRFSAVTLCIMLICSQCLLRLQAAPAPDYKQQYMENLKEKITLVVTKYFPGTEVTYDAKEQKLKASANTMVYTVHGEQMTGDYTEQTYKTEGPLSRGFLLTVEWRDGLDIDQGLGRAQVRSKPYWLLFSKTTRFEAAKGKSYVNFLYGHATNPEFIKDMQAILEAPK